MAGAQNRPDWHRLQEIAAAQEGLFTTQQARAAGFSTALLAHHLQQTGRIIRVHRRIYRVAHFPRSEHDELVIAWLWSEQAGIVSHDTALALHELSDVLPARVHLTLPLSWYGRRLQVLDDVVLHHADIPGGDRTWFGVVPTTNVRRTLNDCARDGFAPELLQQAARQALHRGLVTRDELPDVDKALQPFGGFQ